MTPKNGELLHWKRMFPRARWSPIVAHAWNLRGDYPTHSHDFMEIAVVVSGRGRHASALGEQTLS